MDVDKCLFSMDVGCSYSLPFREGFKKTVTETFHGRDFPKLKSYRKFLNDKVFFPWLGFSIPPIVFSSSIDQVLWPIRCIKYSKQFCFEYLYNVQCIAMYLHLNLQLHLQMQMTKCSHSGARSTRSSLARATPADGSPSSPCFRTKLV